MKSLLPFLIIAFIFLLVKEPFHPSDLYTEIPKGSEELTEMYPLFNQTFTYLGEGSQLIAFVSEDGTTVLKLFKKKHKKSFKFSRLLSSITKNRKQSQRNWSIKFQDTCRRYKMAFAELKEESGLLGLHLHHTKDPLIMMLSVHHKTYQVDLSKHPFIIQKRAILAPEYAKQHPEEARRALKEFFRVRLERGFSDPRQTFSTNYGFIEGKAIQLDVGKIEHFEGDPSAEIAKIDDRVDYWILRILESNR